MATVWQTNHAPGKKKRITIHTITITIKISNKKKVNNKIKSTSLDL